jgi:hypothetical protein
MSVGLALPRRQTLGRCACGLHQSVLKVTEAKSLFLYDLGNNDGRLLFVRDATCSLRRG